MLQAPFQLGSFIFVLTFLLICTLCIIFLWISKMFLLICSWATTILLTECCIAGLTLIKSSRELAVWRRVLKVIIITSLAISSWVDLIWQSACLFPGTPKILKPEKPAEHKEVLCWKQYNMKPLEFNPCFSL